MLKSVVRRRQAAVAAALVGLSCLNPSLQAADGTWTGSTSGTWEVPGNWTGGVPGATSGTANTDTATFNTTSGSSTVTVDLNRNLANLVLSGSSAYTIGSIGGNPLLMTDGGFITSEATAKQTVNAGLVLQGQGPTAFAIYNNSAAAGNYLTIAGPISGVSGTPTLTLSGSNLVPYPYVNTTTLSNVVSGVISNGTATSLALSKTDSGSWILSGVNTYTGGTNIEAGVLQVRDNSALGKGDVNVAAGAQLQIAKNGLNVANNVTLNGTSPGGALVGGIDTSTNSVTLSGTLTLAQTSNVSSYWSDKTLTLAGKVTGVGGLQIDKALAANNPPNVALTNANNDFQGGTTLNAGVLIFSTNALPGTITFAGSSTLRWNTSTTQDISSKVQAIPSNVVATFDTNGNNVTFATALSGAGSIIKTGGGNLTVASANTYGGTTTLSGGTLITPTIADSGASGISTGAVTLSGGALQYSGTGAAVTNRTFSANNATGGMISVSDANGSLEITSGFAGNSGSTLKKAGAGSLTLSGSTDNPNLMLEAQAGLTNLNKSTATNVRAVSGIAAIATGATVKLTGTSSDQIYGGGWSATNPNVGGVNLTGGTLDLNGKSEGFDRLTGNGVVTNNAAAGTTSTLTIGENNGLSAAGNVTVFAGAIKDGISGGKVALVKNGTGTVSLTGNNTYTGTTTISGGTLRLGVPMTSDLPVAGAKMWLDASDASSVTTSGTSVSAWNDKSGNGNNATQGTAANQPTYTTNATLGGKKVIHFSASGQVFSAPLQTLLNNSAYTIFSVEGKQSTGSGVYYLGTLTNSANKGLHVGYRANGTYTLAQYSNDLDYADASLNYTAGNQVFRVWDDQLNMTAGATAGHSIALNGVIKASNTSTGPLNGPGAGVIGQGYNGASTQYIGDLGEIILYTTALTREERQLVDAYLQAKWLGAPTNVLPSTTAVDITASSATLDLNDSNQTVGSLAGVAGSKVTLGSGTLTVGDASTTSFAGVISGTGGVTKQGAGTTILAGDNTYTGPTNITAGKFVVGQGGSGSLAGTSVTVGGATAVLGGSGSIAGPLNVTAGSVAPGNSVGTLSTGDLTLSGGELSIELDPKNTQGNGTADNLNVSGLVSLSGGSLSLSLLSQPELGQTFQIVTNDGSDPIAGTFANGSTITVGNATFSIAYDRGTGNDIVLTTTAVPEPATAAVLGLGVIGLLARRRRR